MTSPTDPSDRDFDAASSRLNDGIRSCRSVLANYRALLVDDGDEWTGQAGFSETGEGPGDPAN